MSPDTQKGPSLSIQVVIAVVVLVLVGIGLLVYFVRDERPAGGSVGRRIRSVGGKSDNELVPGPRPAQSPALQARAESLFAKQCATCHGRQGRGDGQAAYLLYPKPRDFGEAKFRLVSTDNKVPTDEDLFRTITRGIPRSAMPDWRHLPELDRWALVYHVRKLAREGYAAKLLARSSQSREVG